MQILVIINSNLSTKTASFWRRNGEQIETAFPTAQYLFPDNNFPDLSTDFEYCKLVILIGDTSFFHHVINSIFNIPSHSKSGRKIAFIPDTKESAIRSNLHLPVKITAQIELIQSQQSMPLDLIRCHYIDRKGIPASILVLNDILIGVPVSGLPLFFKAFIRWVKIVFNYASMKKKHRIKLKQGDQVIFEGHYLFSLILLGNKITKGSLSYHSAKTRVGKRSFEYIQFTSQSFKDYSASLPQLLSGNIRYDKKSSFIKKFDCLEIQGIGDENELIADGIHIGRLPASFTFLPNALEVISPWTLKPMKAKWNKKLTPSSLPAALPQLPRSCL